MKRPRTAEERKLAGALDWFANTLSEFGCPDDPDPVDDLAGVLDGDRELAALLWARFNGLPATAQVHFQLIKGEGELREWLEAIILEGKRGVAQEIEATPVRLDELKFCTCCGMSLAAGSQAMSRYDGSELFAAACYEAGMRGAAAAS